jgi:peptidylprolyl isomerase
VVAIFVVLALALTRTGPSTANTNATGARKTYSAPPPMTIDASKTYMATITTPRGDIVLKLRPDLAPQTVNSFVFLSREGFYNGLTWHRVLPGFMAQGGDPQGTGGGGPGYTIPAEFTDKVLFDHPGVMAMARPGNDINGNGSQFFITTAPAPSLNQQYTVFGEVVQGQEIVDGIPLRDPEQNPTEPGEQIVQITIAEQ